MLKPHCNDNNEKKNNNNKRAMMALGHSPEYHFEPNYFKICPAV